MPAITNPSLPCGAGTDVLAPAQRIARFVAAVTAALADPEVARRVAAAGVLVRLDFTDRPVQPVFLRLDVEVPYATTEPHAPRADVVLTLATTDLDACLRVGRELPLRILSGEIRFEGCVRKLLKVMPVLRAAVQAADQQG